MCGDLKYTGITYISSVPFASVRWNLVCLIDKYTSSFDDIVGKDHVLIVFSGTSLSSSAMMTECDM